MIATPEDMSEWIGTVSATLKFTVKDCDPTTGEPDSDEGYPDEYVLEDLEMTIADYVQRTMKANFGAAWEELVGTTLYYSVVVHLLCIVLANVKVEIVFVNIIKLNFMQKLQGAENELEDTFALSSMKTLEEAVKTITQFLGMQPCERSDKVPEGKSSHTLVCAGVFRSEIAILDIKP